MHNERRSTKNNMLPLYIVLQACSNLVKTTSDDFHQRIHQPMQCRQVFLQAALLSLIGFVFPVLSATAADGSPGGPVTLQVSALPDKGGQYDLHISMQNEGSTPLKVFKAGLPWGNSRSMFLTVVRNRTVLTGPIAIDDPVAGDVVLQPGETVRGEINLSARYPKLTEELKTSDLDVLWTYQVVTTNGATMQRLGGWLPITKKR